jgi:hypothetical protein
MSDREAFERVYHKETGLYASWSPNNKGYTDAIAGMCYRIWQAARARYASGGEDVSTLLAERDALEKDAKNFRELERRFHEMKTSRCEQALDAFGLPLPNIEETGCFGTLADAIEATKRQEVGE